MDWNKYYQAPLTLKGLLSNLYGQKEFLSVILEAGAKNILEVGVGSGAMSTFFSWLGLNVTGIDISPEVIEKAKTESARFNGLAKFEVADTFSLPYSDLSFDLVFHQGLMEHFSDADIHKIFNEQLRVARRVVFSVPNHRYPRRDFGNERLMAKSQWEQILQPYQVVTSCSYSPKFFPKWYLPRVKIQYMAVIEKPNGS
ncbi:hypothetical protein A3K24_01995 [candidate division Kazan bacterium RIFCSPHIGHO2_01_FULL_44_14]|uniref:Methyltransferase domain-containing protein n=1 Tax=candidate division Kazan bacterium RIFCSPLOWO2_01_FULL_45_19 TaxID=1798538 RepID=A0A1F4NQN8_UNCK3|nr:hypothetical protein [uncultured bacterium]AQS31019.1 hypothetical protein [uncultured bacterium]OGB73598.1 MAG: hypothetical protein A3K51_01995 [candidate division Kazan bacterium RIFCSPLOWO2_01_FULL_45_19]OGB77843.1 MAG: hypothetical protein A3K24_01995 [candidate division Kazan bacterium RIFCSPHIGHO2_01_FULL_44_14]